MWKLDSNLIKPSFFLTDNSVLGTRPDQVLVGHFCKSLTNSDQNTQVIWDRREWYCFLINSQNLLWSTGSEDSVSRVGQCREDDDLENVVGWRYQYSHAYSGSHLSAGCLCVCKLLTVEMAAMVSLLPRWILNCGLALCCAFGTGLSH
jgi:hypothetical protein